EPALERREYSDQSHIPVRVVEDQRDGLLAMLYVVRRSLVELLEQRGEQFVEHEVARFLIESDRLVRGRIVGAPDADQPGEAEQLDKRDNTFCFHDAH